MKKTIALILMLVILLPSQSFAASVSTSSIEKLYFEDYKDRVKEVKDAQKQLSVVACPDVQTLTAKSKASVAKYTSLSKSKASKDTLAKAKSVRDADKKALSEAKKDCTQLVKSMKTGSNSMLKDIERFKKELIKEIKVHKDGKDNLSPNDFNKRVNGGLSIIDKGFDNILKYLKS